MGPLGLLQEDDGQSFDVKEEDAVALVSTEPTSQNHFRSSRALRLRGKAVKKERRKLSFFLLILCCVYGCKRINLHLYV